VLLNRLQTLLADQLLLAGLALKRSRFMIARPILAKHRNRADGAKRMICAGLCREAPMHATVNIFIERQSHGGEL
jgi:hypothetical protein